MCQEAGFQRVQTSANVYKRYQTWRGIKVVAGVFALLWLDGVAHMEGRDVEKPI
jgi:hypothetical protein